MSTLFCFGMGYCAKALGTRLAVTGGWRNIGTSRTSAGAAAIKVAGFEGLVFDGRTASVQLSEAIAASNHVLVSVPPAVGGDPVLKGCHAVLADARNLRWI